MKKRIISVILTLSMLFSMVPMMGVGVGAATATHADAKKCAMIPYAYTATEFMYLDYFKAFKAILYNGYDIEYIETQINESPFGYIINEHFDSSILEKIAIGWRQIACTLVGGQVFSKEEIYQYLLIESILDVAYETVSPLDLCAEVFRCILEVPLYSENESSSISLGDILFANSQDSQTIRGKLSEFFMILPIIQMNG